MHALFTSDHRGHRRVILLCDKLADYVTQSCGDWLRMAGRRIPIRTLGHVTTKSMCVIRSVFNSLYHWTYSFNCSKDVK